MRKIWKMCLSMMMIFSLALGNVNAVKANSQDQMIEIKNRLKTYFLDLDTIDDGSKVETCYVNQANKYLKLIEEDGSFKDVDYKSTTNAANGGAWSPYLALDRMQAIAIAYHKEGNDLYQKKEVIEKLQKAINYWNTQNPRSTNWWENQVGVQLRFSRIALFMEDIIDDESYQILLNKLLEKKPVKYGTGQNNLWFDQNYVYYSLLSNDKDQLKDMVNNYLNYCLSIQLDDITSEAVQVDNSFYMHGRQFYSNGYGMSMFRDMSFWIYMLRDTDFAIGQDVIDRMADYMLDGTSWTIRGDIMELYLGYRPYKYEVGYENYASEYIEPLKRMIVSDKKNAKKYQDVLNNITGESSSNGKNGHYYMWRSGYASHMRETYGVNIKMDSQNIIGGEWRGSWPSGQDQGQLIYWTSSAVSTVTVDGDEYTNVYPVYDWAHCPGATTPNRIVKDYSNSGRFMNGTDHTIGVSDGKYGSTAYVMDKKGTQATKGYFFFDDEFVALGAGINSTETTAIHTTLNQCEANQIKVNGESVSLGTVGKEYNTNYIYNDKIGYVFLENTKVNVSYDSQKDAASLWDETKKQEASDVFTAYLDHGVKPTDASYAYIVVPDKNENEVKQYANNIPVTIIVNNKNVQAVRHDGLKQTQIHFYSAGSLEYKPGYTITVDKPCSMIIDESSENRKITAAVSDDQAMQTIQVQLSHDMQTTTTTFVSAALPYAGKSMTLNEGENDRYHASSCTDNHGVENIVDSSEKTYWESENNQEQWISVFTGTNQFIKSMNITWGDHFASQYDVYISQDGKNYQLLQSITDGNGGKDDISINELCSYVKIIMKESNDNNFQIKDISFYSSQLLSLNKNV
ncbi:MAG: polysaccharide lyase family 8 super-sandwich domain-containing protein, partial [Faecalibacillus sp.]